MRSDPIPPTDGDSITIINFDTETAYKIGKITYRVTSHFDDNGEDLKTKVARLLKQDLEFELSGSLTQSDE